MPEVEQPTDQEVTGNFVLFIALRAGEAIHTTVIEGFTTRLAGEAAGVRIRDNEKIKQGGYSSVAIICFEKK